MQTEHAPNATPISMYTQYRWLILGITLVGLVATVVFSLLEKPYYDTSISFSINQTNKQDTADYQYDGYYAIQASDLFSQTVMSWFLTPSVLLEIYQGAGIDPQISSIDEITSRFKTKKFSPQNIVVRYKERDRETAQKIAAAIVNVIEERAAASNQSSDNKSLFEVKGGEPVIVERQPNVLLNTGIGLVASIVLSLIAAYSIGYLRAPAPTRQP